jgi:hypothetical protein
VTSPHDFPDLPPHAEVLGDVLPAEGAVRSRRTGRWLVVGTAVATAAVGGAAVLAAVALSGGGPQPEDVLPSGAIGFAKVDLDPSASQKLNVFALSRKFPDAADELTSEDSLRDDVLRLAFEESELLDYDADVKPWIGDRVGVAVLPSGGDEPNVVAAVAYTDREKAEAGLRKAQQEVGEEEPLEYAFVDDYVLLGDDAAVVRAAADAEEHLADDEAFGDGMDSLDGDQIVTSWVDLGRLWDALPDEVREQAASSSGSEGLELSGHVVLGVRAEKDAVELVAKAVDVETGLESQDALVAQEGTGLAGRLPRQAIVALSVSGLGKGLAEGYEDIVAGLEDLAPDLEAQAEELGFDLPGDLETVLGDETALALWGDDDEPQGLVRTRNDDPSAALDVLERAFEQSGGGESGEDFRDYARTIEGGVVAGTPEAVKAAEGKGLAEREEFRRAVPDAETAGFVLWVSLREALERAGLDDEQLEPLEAVGVTASGSGTTATARLRLTFR